MADVIATFSKANDDNTLASGADARTEVMTIGAGAVTSTLSAQGSENVVELLATGDAWVAVGSAPATHVTNSATGTRRRPIKSGERLYLTVRPNNHDKVAIITRA